MAFLTKLRTILRRPYHPAYALVVLIASALAAVAIPTRGATATASPWSTPWTQRLEVGTYATMGYAPTLPAPGTGLALDHAVDLVIQERHNAFAEECVFFHPDGTRDVSDAVFAFTGSDDNYQPVSDEMLDVWGPITSPITMLPGNSTHLSKNCRPTSIGAYMYVALSGVTYQDGSMWHAVPSIPGTVFGSTPPGVVIDSAWVLAGVTPSGKHGNTPFPPELFECGRVQNGGSQTVTRIRIAFAHLAIGGANLGNDVLDFQTSVAPGASSGDLCGNFPGATDPGIFSYAKAASSGRPNSTPPQVLLKGKPSSLTASITEVDFADGSFWRPQP